MCEAVFLYQVALRGDGNSIAGGSVLAAVDALGQGFQSLLDLDGGAVYTPARRNTVPTVYRPVLYLTSCSCFQYSGSTYSMP